MENGKIPNIQGGEMIDLAYIRNMLLRASFDDDSRNILYKIKINCKNEMSPFESLISLCIENALSDIESGDFESAACEINFIHNLPFSVREIQTWDEKHFYSFELIQYLDGTKNHNRFKKYICEICKASQNIEKSQFLPKRSV